ncbi:hypothetical protein [Microbacterium sp. NPDC087591]|uniref:hypothetical protein n=1 Tax=Microbacterium sp. NPDC087591 TaxID=3364192 RepID=UPI00381FDAD9
MNMIKAPQWRTTVLYSTGLATLLTVALASCAAMPPGEDSDSSSMAPATGSATAVTAVAKLGDCRVQGPSGLPGDARVVPCAEPHDEEIFHSISLPEMDYSAETLDAASSECVGDEFTKFIGVDKAESSLDVFPLIPTQEEWDVPGARKIFCVVFDMDGKVKGSLAGSSR